MENSRHRNCADGTFYSSTFPSTSLIGVETARKGCMAPFSTESRNGVEFPIVRSMREQMRAFASKVLARREKMSPVVIHPKRFEDSRGWFSETWNARLFTQAGISQEFCQDNQSLSKAKGTIRGLHFQAPPHAQAKLVRCIQGRIFDVAVDIRKSSPTFAQWVGVELSAENSKQLFVPAGYAHGFVTLEDECLVAYKVDAYYSASDDGGIAWNDPTIGIDWPIDKDPILSPKDSKLPGLTELDVDFPYDDLALGVLAEVTL